MIRCRMLGSIRLTLIALIAPPLIGLTLISVPIAAYAQGNPAALQAPGIVPDKAGKVGKAPDAAPRAVPGARAEPTAVAPAGKNVGDLPPTEALFDAINRGDLPAAKDAVNRGADLNGSNVLGLTPLELAVDLGRNEISFLLLSLRGGSGYTTSRGPAAAPKPPTRAERMATDRAERLERTRVRAVTAAPAIATPPQTARLFSGNGGAPVPQAGFLGFDAGR